MGKDGLTRPRREAPVVEIGERSKLVVAAKASRQPPVGDLAIEGITSGEVRSKEWSKRSRAWIMPVVDRICPAH